MTKSEDYRRYAAECLRLVVGTGYGDMRCSIEKCDRFTWLHLLTSMMPPRNPNNNNGDDEDEDYDEDDEEHEDCELPVIREPEPDE